MARIRKIEIANFRGIQWLAWCPTPGINCLIGPGDSGKSTVLDAIDLCLGARRNVQFSDADFFGLDITTPISITLTLGDLDDSMRTLESFGAFLRGYHANTGVVEDEPSAGARLIRDVCEHKQEDIGARAAACVRSRYSFTAYLDRLIGVLQSLEGTR